MIALLLFSLPCLSVYSSAFPIPEERNDRPIIGILAQEVRSPSPGQSSYIAASYVKTLESAGARVVPVMVNQTEEEYKALFNSINGILFPGGGSNLVTSLYARSAKIFYDLAIEANDRGDYFPVWATCLGFEELTYLTLGKLVLIKNNMRDVALPLNFTNEAKESKMFKDFPADLMKDLASQSLTANAHKWSLAVSAYESNPELKNFYKVLSTNSDGTLGFVSTIEAHNYPIYGTQWHPEKNAFEFTKAYVAHSPSAVRTSFYVAEFFVSEARKSKHGFGSEAEERKALIYNYSPVYSGPNSTFVQIYYF